MLAEELLEEDLQMDSKCEQREVEEEWKRMKERIKRGGEKEEIKVKSKKG